jgi:hypothetical protein
VNSPQAIGALFFLELSFISSAGNKKAIHCEVRWAMRS